MGIGADLADVLTEVGSSYTIIRGSGNVSGEYGDISYSSQVTKPITIESFRRITMPYNTQAVAGDVLELDVTGVRYLMMNKLHEQFENEVIGIEGILYKCNIASGELLRPSGETWSADTYHKETQWQVIKNNCDAMQVAALYGNDLESDREMALMGVQKDEVYIAHSVGVQVLDRWQPASGEYYQVSTIEQRRFQSVDVLIVEEDHR